jgi:Arylsulfotransferase (ASST)
LPIAPMLLVISLAAAAGCRATPEAPTGNAALSANISTVVNVKWSDPDGSNGIVEYGPTTDYGMEAPARVNDRGGFKADLLGLKPDAEVHFRIIYDSPDGQQVGADQTITTGSSPTDLPAVQTELSLPDQVSDGFILTGMFGGGRSGAVVMDTDGDVVWWSLADDRLSVRSILSVDGSSIIYNIVEQDLDTSGNALVRAPLDGSAVENIPAPGHHHDFTELPDGTLAYIAYDIRTIGGEEVYGDRLIEVAPDGTQTEVFNVWDHLEYVPGGALAAGETWTHANAVDYDPTDDTYYIGLRSFSSIWKVQRSTGEPVWELGGGMSDFEFSDPTDEFYQQHQFERVDDTIVVFDNQSEEVGESRAIELRLDEDNGTADFVWEYEADPALHCYVLGDVDRLDNGNTLVTFTTAGQIDEVSPTGELIWRLNIGIGAGMAYTRQVPSLYPAE